jgi:hypothetical protein
MLIVLAAILLIFIVWWIVAAQTKEETVVVPGPEQPVTPPTPMPEPPPSAQAPVIVERERPVNIYVERNRPEPRVIIVPEGRQPPEAMERLRKVDLPDRFRYQGKVWEPSDEAFARGVLDLRDTGASVNGNIIYTEQVAVSPYEELYIETSPGSGIYLKYIPAG